MVRRLVKRGRRAGLEMWGCRRYPACDGAINIDPEAETAKRASVAGHRPSKYAQQKLEDAKARDRLKRRALLPLAIAFGIFFMAMAAIAAWPAGQFWVVIAVGAVGLTWTLGMFRLPFESLVWARGIDGERRVAEALEPLQKLGFIALYNRRLPNLRGDIDCVLIGPTGVFVIETKNWSGRASVRGNSLLIGASDRSWVIEQVYREALAVQLALAGPLTEASVTVVPIVCVVGGFSGRSRSLRGVELLEPQQLSDWIAARSTVLTELVVADIANRASSAMPEELPWEQT